MIKPDKNKFIIKFLNQYFNFIIKKQFRKLVVKEMPELDKTKSTLVIGNHFSWWDGILINEINNLFLKKDFYVLMLEDQLSKNKILAKAGAFSINRNSRSMIETFNYCKNLLKNKETILLFYPQGEITSIHQEEISFQKGLTKLLDNSVQLVFYTCLPDYFSNSKPNLYFYFQSYDHLHKSSIEEIQTVYNGYYKACKAKQSKTKP